MYNLFKLTRKYLRYYLTASNGKGHGIHSPFVFDFIIHVLNDKKKYPAYELVEGLRKNLLNDQRELVVQDFGAGSGRDKKDLRSVAAIARNAAKPARYGQLLYRIVKYYQPQVILELGTSLGITSSYLSLAKPDAVTITLEGAPAIVSAASQNFRELKLTNTTIIEGNFDSTVPGIVAKQARIDFAFIDGNHRLQPTLSYFETILAKTSPGSIIVLDDIHWSSEMEEAWLAIKNHVSVKCSVDLFFIGIVFLRDDFKEKQHFTIRF